MDRAKAAPSRRRATPSPARCWRRRSRARGASCSPSPGVAISACSRSTRRPRSSTGWRTPTPTSSSVRSSTTRWATRCGSPSSPPASTAGTTATPPASDLWHAAPTVRAPGSAARSTTRRAASARRRGSTISTSRPTTSSTSPRSSSSRGVRPPAETAALSHALPLASGTGPAHVAHVRFTSAADGDLRVDGAQPALDARRRALVAGPWTWLRPVHGRVVVTVDVAGAPLAVHTADCAPVALVADGGDGAGGENGGLVAAVHAGWRGLAAGVVERAADALRDAGATGLRAVVGPCIHPCCYEFGVADLDRVAGRYGDGVRAVTTTGRHALDLPAAVGQALAAADADVVAPSPACTGCGTPPFFSHRARGDTARQAMVVWIEAAWTMHPSRVTGQQGASDRGPSGPLRSSKSGNQ